jgi:hypothetical protein
MEWIYRTYREPTRLASRYARNAFFALKMIVTGRAVGNGTKRDEMRSAGFVLDGRRGEDP